MNTGVALFVEGVAAANPLACVPLKIEDRLVGLVAVYRIEEHKAGLSDLDKELFELLANQTATAMMSSRVYSETVKKLKYMESFLSLIKPE
jgi:GAF domain-containing protein